MPSTNTSTQSPQPQFKPFSWHINPSYTIDENLASAARDIGYGIQLVLEILERDELAPDNGEAPILNQADRGILIRMAISSAKLLGASAEDNIEASNERKRNMKAGGAHV